MQPNEIISVRIKETGKVIRTFIDRAKVWVASGYAEYVIGHFKESAMLKQDREISTMPNAKGR